MNINSPMKAPGNTVSSPRTATPQRITHDGVHVYQGQVFFASTGNIAYDSKSQVMQQGQAVTMELSSSPGNVNVMPQSPFIVRAPNPVAIQTTTGQIQQAQQYQLMNASYGTVDVTTARQAAASSVRGYPINVNQFGYTQNVSQRASVSGQPSVSPQQQPPLPQASGQPHQGGGKLPMYMYAVTDSTVPPPNARIAPQQLPRGAMHRFATTGYPPGPSTPVPQLVPRQQQVYTPQGPSQMVPSTPGTPRTPAPPSVPPTPRTSSSSLGTPTTPGHGPGSMPIGPGQPLPGPGFYPPVSYVNNFPHNPSNQPNYIQSQMVQQQQNARHFSSQLNATANSDPNQYTQQQNASAAAVAAAIAAGGSLGAQSLPRVAIGGGSGSSGQPKVQFLIADSSANFTQKLPQPGVGTLRSPSIISPNQQPQQSIPSQPAIPPQQLQLHSSTHRFQSYVPMEQSIIIPPEVCLAGCCFLLAENSSGIDARTLATMVRYYGGELEFSPNRGTLDRITHVIGEYVSTQTVSMVLERKEAPKRRVCTLQWLNDVIARRHVDAPFKVCHLPACMNRIVSLTNKVISVTGFEEREVANLKWMIQIIGAKFSPYLSKHTNFLVAKHPNSPKVDHVPALTTSIQIVNSYWLCELYLGLTAPLSEPRNTRYSVNTYAPVDIGTRDLINFNEQCSRMMQNWKYQVKLNEDHVRRSYEIRKQILADESLFVAQKFGKLLDIGPVPTDFEINEANKMFDSLNAKPNISVVFSAIPARETEILAKKAQMLGVTIIKDVQACTFVISPYLMRTPNIIRAMGSGKDIVTPLWIIHSYAQLRLLPVDDYYLQDSVNEKLYTINVRHTVLSARRQRIFENTWFYLTPSVKPSREVLSAIIQSAGGNIEEEKPTVLRVLKKYECEHLYFIIANPADLPFLQKITDINYPIFCEEFVFCSIMRYKIDTTNFFAINLKHQQGMPNRRGQVTPIQKTSFIAATAQVKS